VSNHCGGSSPPAPTMLNLFPKLHGVWGHLNLNELSRDVKGEPNPLLLPAYCEKWVDNQHKIHGLDFSYGGYMELRDHLWRGSYLPPAPFHLGVDYNVPALTAVAVPADAELVWAETSPDQNGGWGGRVVFRVDFYIGIMGHLSILPEIKRLPKGSMLKRGHVIGHVAHADENGGWFPHLHVQLTTQTVFDGIMRKGTDFDGYEEWHPHILNHWRDPHIIFPKPDPAQQQSNRNSRTANRIGEWIDFVRASGYTEHHANWPTRADASHSNLLRRMLAGESPLPKEQYNKVKNDPK
jgi:hypothetical protein